jgi:hypothetical protein
MNLSSFVAISVFIATLILHSYQPMSMLSWTQRTKRKRAMIIVSIACLAALFSNKIPGDRYWAAASFGAAILVSSQFFRHLRQQGGIWASPRLGFLTKFISFGFAFCVGTIGLFWPNVWGMLCIAFGFWNATLLSAENQEITNEFSNLRNRLSTLYAQQQSLTTTERVSSSEPRDNSHKAS